MNTMTKNSKNGQNKIMKINIRKKRKNKKKKKIRCKIFKINWTRQMKILKNKYKNYRKHMNNFKRGQMRKKNICQMRILN